MIKSIAMISCVFLVSACGDASKQQKIDVSTSIQSTKSSCRGACQDQQAFPTEST